MYREFCKRVFRGNISQSITLTGRGNPPTWRQKMTTDRDTAAWLYINRLHPNATNQQKMDLYNAWNAAFIFTKHEQEGV